MAHFAQLDENNVVLGIVVVANSDTMDENGVEREEIGIQYLKSILGEDTRWKQTSYNNNIRKRYAEIGGTYDEVLDVFIPFKPYIDWIFNEESWNWDPPFPEPALTNEEISLGYDYDWSPASTETGQGEWILIQKVFTPPDPDPTITSPDPLPE